MPNYMIPNQWLSPLSKEQQINELNNEVRCKLGVSKIDGVGVFAIRDIRAGDKCYIAPNFIPKFYDIPFGSLSKLLPEIKELVLARWASCVNGSIFCSPNDEAHLLMFANHSCDPNYDVVSDTALRDIRAGEEIFENYTAMENWEKVRPLNKNPWLNCKKDNIIKSNKSWLIVVINAVKLKLLKSLGVVHLVRLRIKNFAPNWTRGQK